MLWIQTAGNKVELTPVLIRAFYRRLLMAGYTPKQAGNLIALVLGMETAENGWTVRELVQLLFIRKIADKIE